MSALSYIKYRGGGIVLSKRISFESKVVTWAETGPVDTVKAILGICNEKVKLRATLPFNPPPVKGKRKYIRKARPGVDVQNTVGGD